MQTGRNQTTPDYSMDTTDVNTFMDQHVYAECDARSVDHNHPTDESIYFKSLNTLHQATPGTGESEEYFETREEFLRYEIAATPSWMTRDELNLAEQQLECSCPTYDWNHWDCAECTYDHACLRAACESMAIPGVVHETPRTCTQCEKAAVIASVRAVCV